MKKNRLMKAAAFLCMMTLMTSCFVGGTFAKYVTSGSGSDKARVAKWGIEVTANGSTFAKGYVKNDETYILNTYSVYTSNDDNVIAPGTSGEMVSMTLKGQPEVATRVTYTVDTFNLAGWNENGVSYYCPIFITINGTPLSGLDYQSEQEFEAAVKTAIESYSKDYEANVNLGSKGDESLKISWKWDYYGATGLNGTQTDVKDTSLGNQAAEGKAATIELGITTTVTQID